jgi:ERCC4-type nuclease
MIILQDTREQRPFTFERFDDVMVQAEGLPVGDYSIPGFTDRVGIERKELNDLIGCFTSERERFERELSKARHFELFCIVVESELSDLADGNYRSEMNPASAIQSMVAFMVRYRVPFLFCKDRRGAEYMTYSLLTKYARELEKRYQHMTKHCFSEAEAEKQLIGLQGKMQGKKSNVKRA